MIVPKHCTLFISGRKTFFVNKRFSCIFCFLHDMRFYTKNGLIDWQGCA
jgi:hypothetical protein